MKRNIRAAVMAGAALAAAAGCTGDPTASLRGGGPRRLLLSASSLTINVLDSVAVTATVADDQGNPLPDVATATSSAPAVVQVISASGAPLPLTKFFLKALLYGEGFVTVTAGAATDSIKVFAFPAAVTVTGTPDSLNSGSTVDLTATARDAVGGAMTGVAPFTWSSSDDLIAAVTSPGNVTTVSGYAAGVASLNVSVPGAASTTVPLRVVPAPFGGNLSAPSGGLGAEITATRGAGDLPFDDATFVTVDGSGTLVTLIDADNISFPIPPVLAAGSTQVWLQGLGPDGLATRTSLTVTTAGLVDAHETDDPFTSTEITANGDYFIILSGNCTDEGDGIGIGPIGSDCDDYLRIRNTTGSPKTVSVELDWPEADADPDLYLFDSNFDAFLNGSFFDHPEVADVALADGQGMILWSNLYEDAGHQWVFVRVRVSGL